MERGAVFTGSYGEYMAKDLYQPAVQAASEKAQLSGHTYS